MCDMTQAEVADKLNIHVNTYRLYEKCAAKITIGMLVRICDALDIKVEDIKLFNTDNRPYTEE